VNHGTVLKEYISYYVSNQSSVFCTFVGASKAFGRVRYCRLFKLLVSRQVQALIIRVLIDFYLGNLVCVQWCGIVFQLATALSRVAFWLDAI